MFECLFLKILSAIKAIIASVTYKNTLFYVGVDRKY